MTKRPFSIEPADEAFVATMPENLRRLVRAAQSGVKYEELATEFGIAVGTVRSRLHRARNSIEAARNPKEPLNVRRIAQVQQ